MRLLVHRVFIVKMKEKRETLTHNECSNIQYNRLFVLPLTRDKQGRNTFRDLLKTLSTKGQEDLCGEGIYFCMCLCEYV